MPKNTNKPNRVVVFRTGTTEEQAIIDMLSKELGSGRLRQGWGRNGLNLQNKSGEKGIGKTEWEENYKKAWGETPTSRRYSALIKMLELETGDIVVIPNLPKRKEFSIVRVSDKYYFDGGNTTINTNDLRDDFRHVIRVNGDSIRIFNRRANNEAYAIYSLFPRANHRYPVTFAYNESHIDAAMRLLEQDSKRTAEPKEKLIQVALDDALKVAAKAMLKEVSGWSGLQFEEAVKATFVKQGYIDKSKEYQRYDGKGADVDIVVSPPSNHSHSLFMPTEIAVQVKCKQGIDDKDVHAVEQLVAWKGSELVQKFVISSAKDFTDNCKEKAYDEGITLIGGLDAMYFLMGVSNFK